MYVLLKSISAMPLGTVLVVILVLLAVLRDWRWLVLLWALQSVPVAMLLRLYLPLPWAIAQVFVAGLIALMLALSLRGRQTNSNLPTIWLWRIGFLPLVAVVVWWLGGYIPTPWHNNVYLLSLATVAALEILVGDDRLSSGIGLLLAWEGFMVAIAMILPPETAMLGLYVAEIVLGLSIAYLALVENSREEGFA